MKHSYVISLILAAIVMLSACTVFDRNMGESVDNNTQAQVVDPYAGHTESVSTIDGQKAEKLLKDYRVEKAKAPTERLLKDIGN